MWKNKEELKEYHRNWHRKNSKNKTIDSKPGINQIKCDVCQQIVGIKGFAKHLKIHNLLIEQYVETHLEEFARYGWAKCVICGKITKGTTCSRKCAGIYKSQLYKGRKAWNEGIKMPDEYCKKLSDMRAGRPGILHTVETKNLMSRSAKLRASQPEYVNPMQGKTHTEEALKKIFSYKGISSAEKLAMKTMNENNIRYKHQFFLKTDTDTYSYDFLIGQNVLIEIDGDYWHGGPGVKTAWYGVEGQKARDITKNQVATDRGFKLIHVWESDLKSNPEILINMIKDSLE